MIFQLVLVLIIPTIVSSRMIGRQTDGKRASNDDPKHEVKQIYWPRVEKRSLDGTSSVSVRALDRKINLNLRPIINEVLFGDATPVFEVYEVENEPVIRRAHRSIARLARVFRNRKNRASLSVIDDAKRRKRSITGLTESYNLTTNPVSDGTNCSIDEIPIEEIGDHHCHVISQEKLPQTYHRDVKSEARELVINPLTVPAQVVYPEILIIIDYSLYRLFNYRPRKIIPYVLSFWNAVDLKFRSFTSPKIRLNIAGIFLVQTKNALNYTKHLKKNIENRADTTTREMGKCLNKYQDAIPFDFDLGVTMTASELEINGKVIGVALKKGMCQESKKAALVYDRGGYNSILAVAHELAHTMGVQHDNKYPECNSTIPDHIMANKMSLTTNASRWSECSVRSIQEFLRNESNSHCLYNKPNPGAPLDKYLPGKRMTGEEQCLRTAGGDIREMDKSICQELKCFNKFGEHYIRIQGAADGTKCAQNKICFNSNCVFEDQVI